MGTPAEEHFRRIFKEKLLVDMPGNGDEHLNSATRLHEKRREMEQVEHALEAHKEEYKIKMETLQNRREDLVDKEYQLKKSFLKFDKFLKENDSKRARAVQKTTEERIATRAKNEEIEKLCEEINQLTLYRDKKLSKLEKNSKYQRYLDRVIEVADGFQEIRDVTQRYETLITVHNDLSLRANHHQDAMEQEKSNFNRFVEEKNNEILNNNILLAQLQTKLEKTQSRAMFWESKWTRIQDTAAKKTLQLGRIKMSTHNLFNLVNRHVKQTIEVESTEEQLEKIQTFILDLTHITNEIKKSENNAS